MRKLENRYLVLKRSDIEQFVDNANKRKLDILIDKLNKQRAKRGSTPNKRYVVVSEDMKCFDEVTDIVLNEVYGAEDEKKTTYTPPAPKKKSTTKKAPIKKAPSKKQTVKKKRINTNV